MTLVLLCVRLETQFMADVVMEKKEVQMGSSVIYSGNSVSLEVTHKSSK